MTLPGNTALAVGADIKYVKVTRDGEHFILAKDLLEKNFEMDGLIIEEEMDGAALKGKKFEPLFNYYVNSGSTGIENAFKIITTDFVDTETEQE